jgi:uncharacterized protein (TIGR02001 family)
VTKRIAGILLIALLTATGASFAETTVDGHHFSATMYLTTDYISRGRSFSDGDPALQGTFDYYHDLGLFAGIWASSWHSYEPSNDLELGFYGGYANAIGGIDYSLTASYYIYPGAEDDFAEWDYWEFCATAAHTFDQVPLTPTWGIGYTFSPDYSGEDGNMHYGNTSVDFVLPWNLGLGLEAGYFDIEGDKSTGNGAGLDGGDGFDYWHWRVGLSTTLVGFGLDLSYHNTTEREFHRNNFYEGGDRIVFTLSRSL